MNTQYFSYWILVIGCCVNTVVCQESGEKNQNNKYIIVGSIILVLGIFFSVLFYISKCTRNEAEVDVESAGANNADNSPSRGSIFIIESNLRDPPPKYCELLCEAPPPSFESLFPVHVDVTTEVLTDIPTTSIDITCEKS